MIRREVKGAPLTPAEQFGWDVLVDGSRVLVIDERAATGSHRSDWAIDTVVIEILESGARPRASAPGPVALLSALREPVSVSDGRLRLSRERLRAVADVAGAGAEQRTVARDRHQRVPSTENPLVAAGVEREPVVSVAAAELRSAVVRAAGRRPVLAAAPWPEGRRWATALSHDIDVVAWWPLFSGLRLAELAQKGQLGLMGRVAQAVLANVARNPVAAGVQAVIEMEGAAGIASTWFALSGTPTLTTFRQGDLTYRPESARARALFDAVRGAGHEIGLHGSFETMTDTTAMAAQRARLERCAGVPPAGVRQHFLRMRPGETQRTMLSAGFHYDATYGFPDRNGFRLGVADVVPAWDAGTERRAELDEVPLVWMDRAQSKYQQVEEPARWVADALELAAAARRVDGLWVGLWHPNLTPPLGYPGAPAAYQELLRAIVADVRPPFIAPLARMVAWRRLRRAVRVVGVSHDVATVEAPAFREFDIAIEDRAGAPLAVIPQSPGGMGGPATVSVPLHTNR